MTPSRHLSAKRDVTRLLYYLIQMAVNTRLDARVGLAQLDLPSGELEANRERLLEAIRACSEQGANLVVLPELASSGYRIDGWREALAVAEPIPGPTTEGWREAAAAAGCYVVGGICERDGGALYNSVAVVGPRACSRATASSTCSPTSGWSSSPVTPACRSSRCRSAGSAWWSATTCASRRRCGSSRCAAPT
jgi:hypothetical protein